MATILVAIPSENDYVWKLSSEKIPHMTILYLDENSVNANFAQVAGFVEHAADTMLTRFGLDVDHRGELGEDKADVIFFNKNHRWSGYTEVCAFRDMLLKEGNIKTAHDTAEQFDTWEPHLTMGYPATPAKEDDRDYPGISYVSFDRVAIWTDKYDGPELLLKESNMADDIAYAAMGEEAIKHFGVLGMRWGVRKDRAGGKPTAEDIQRARRNVEVETAELAGQDAKIARSTSKAQAQREFDKYNKMRMKHLKNPDRVTAARLTSGEKVVLTLLTGGVGPAGAYLNRKSIESEQKRLAKHTAETVVEDFLEHFGVLGMRWGIRKDSSGRKKGTPSAESESAKAAKTKAKKQGLSSLSNAEIESLNRRTSLEAQYKKDNPSLIAQGTDAALTVLELWGNQPAPKKKS